MTDHVSLLAAILRLGEEAARTGMASADRVAALTELHEQVKGKCYALDGVFLIDAWDVMVVNTMLLLERARFLREDDKATEWSQVLGMMLPKVREHYAAALVWRRDTRPTP